MKERKSQAGSGRQAPDAARAKPRRFPHAALFWAILVLATALRLYVVETANLWHDEFWTLELSCGRDTAHEHLPLDVLMPSLPALTSPAQALPWRDLPGSLSQVTHPPLFFALLRLWRDLLGVSDIAARLLPCVASIAALALLYALVRRLNGPCAALWASALMALSGQQIYYAQEVRSYSMIVLLGVAALWTMIEIERRGPSLGRLGAFGALAFALVMTHYFTVGLLIGLAAYAALRLPRRAKWLVMLSLVVAALLFLIVWAPFMQKQGGAMGLENQGGAAFLLDREPGHIGHTFERLIEVPAESIAPATYMKPAGMPPPVTWLAFPAFLLPLVWLRRRPDLLLWYLCVAGVLLPILLLDLSRSSMHLAFPRYTLLAGPGIFAIIAAGLDRAGKYLRHAVPAVVVIACASSLRAALREPASKPDWQPIASLAAEQMQPGDPFIVTAPADRAPLIYLYVSHYLGPVPRPGAIVTRPISPGLELQLRAYPRVWVISGWQNVPPIFGGARFVLIAQSNVGDLEQIQWSK